MSDIHSPIWRMSVRWQPIDVRSSFADDRIGSLNGSETRIPMLPNRA